MRAIADCFRHFCSLLLLCFAVLSLNAGCCTTSSKPNSSGAAASKPDSSWHFFEPEPKKVQTPGDFIAQPRPQ